MSCPVLLALGIFLSISYGAAVLSLQDVVHAVFHYDSSNITDNIVITSRLPRALGSVIIGILLAVSGALMQGVTRNYLASPSIMGVSEGSAFFVTIAMITAAAASSLGLMLFSFIGSLVAILFVFGIGRLVPNGFQPVRLAIIGIVIGTFFSSLAAALAHFFQISQSVSFWYNSRLDKMDMADVYLVLPFAAAGLIASMAISKSVTILSLGEETAASLGMRPMLIRTTAMLAVALMTGSAVAIGGNIAFIGLVVPHIARFLVGTDYRWLIPCSGLIGGVFLCFSDIASRFFNYPYETPITIVISIICIPFFIYLVYKKGGAQGV
ncbi:FecCD family ABC transporter permease [Paenibacillus sp. 2TAB19]|uniref:FecCD family ABC transporter permease n=1 Tax=Paenibacillus sp. 2TAB19 TaxID=3233003 RepID=UPI003F968D09